eukprot:1136165-Pelagomonas_calceolata.AAC.1
MVVVNSGYVTLTSSSLKLNNPLTKHHLKLDYTAPPPRAPPSLVLPESPHLPMCPVSIDNHDTHSLLYPIIFTQGYG